MVFGEGEAPAEPSSREIWARREAVTRRYVSREIATRSFALVVHLVQSGHVGCLQGLGVDSNATCYRTRSAVGTRSHGPARGHRLGCRPATRPATEHGPGPETTCPAGGSRSYPRRVAAPLPRLWATPTRCSAAVGNHPRVAPSAFPLGGWSHPCRTETDEPSDRAPLRADAPTLAAPAWPGSGPIRSASGQPLAAGRAPTRHLGGRCRRPEAAGRWPDDLLAAGGR